MKNENVVKKNNRSEVVINELSNSRERDNLDSRNNRSENRDVIEITMPDGSKFLKRERTVLGKTDRLFVPKKNGYKRHWFNAVESSRIQYAVDCGFLPAIDINGNQIQSIDGDVDTKGVRQKLYCMEIPLEKWNKLQEETKKMRDGSKKQETDIKNEMGISLDEFSSKTEMFEDKLSILQKK